MLWQGGGVKGVRAQISQTPSIAWLLQQLSSVGCEFSLAQRQMEGFLFQKEKAITQSRKQKDTLPPQISLSNFLIRVIEEFEKKRQAR